MNRTAAPVQPAPGSGGYDDDPLEAGICLFSAFSWALILPLVILHELAHVVASWMLGVRVIGAGVRLEHRGYYGPIPLNRIRAFFIMHEPLDDSSLAQWFVALAPALYLVPAFIFRSTAPWPVSTVFLLVGISVISDLVAGLDLHQEIGLTNAQLVFLIGAPRQVQSTLGWWAS